MKKNSLVIILGLGETGFACAHFLSKQNIPFSIMDTREIPPKLQEFKTQYPSIPVYTGGFDASFLSKATTIILSPGIPKEHPDIVQNISKNTEIIGDIELFARTNQTSVVAITGSNGKSTVTTLVGEMAKAANIKVAVGGNLGTPAVSLLESNPEMTVLELSSFQLETTYSLKPETATILNLMPDHLDRYTSLEAYYAAKERIYQNCEKVVINREDTISKSMAPKNVPTWTFGLNNSEDDNAFGLILRNDEYWLSRGQQALLPKSKLRIIGRHNIANALAALALGESVNLPLPAMLNTLQTFTGLEHRCEWVAHSKKILWINDSKGTNVGSTLAALQGLKSEIPGKWILIAGGLGKNQDFSPLIPAVSEVCRFVILIGKAADEFETLFSPTVPCKKVNSLEDAVQLAEGQANPGDGVLLSPACASYDMFQNFEERGKSFKAAVHTLIKGESE